MKKNTTKISDNISSSEQVKKSINKKRHIPLELIDLTSEPVSKHKRYYEKNRESLLIGKKEYYQKHKKTLLSKSKSTKIFKTAFIANFLIDENLIEENNVRDLNLVCEFCQAKHFTFELPRDKKFPNCCHKGKVSLSEDPPYPMELRNLIIGTTSKKIFFRVSGSAERRGAERDCGTRENSALIGQLG